MTKARQLADLGNAYDDGALSNRNLIINGGLLCWQRGTSHSVSGGIVYTADRFWKYSPSVSGTYERSTDAPDGFAYSMHYNVDGSTAGSGTTVEFSRQGYFPQGQYTFSFYVKGDLTNTNLGIGFRNTVGSGTDQVNFSPITNYGNYTEWTRVVRTFTINLAPHANNKFLNLEFAGMPAGVKFTGVQLEVGDTATPFEHRSYGDELAKCKRYFEKQTFTGGYQFVCNSINTSTTEVEGFIPFGIEKRASPTVTSSAATTWRVNGLGNDANASGISWFTGTPYGVRGKWVRGSGTHTIRDASYVNVENASPHEAYVNIDAEL